MELIDNHENFTSFNKNPQRCISSSIDLQFPRTGEWKEFFGETHINEPSIRVLSAISSSNDKISSKIAPFIIEQMSQYENDKAKDMNFIIKFGIQFILHSSNSKYREAIEAVINLYSQNSKEIQQSWQKQIFHQ